MLKVMLANQFLKEFCAIDQKKNNYYNDFVNATKFVIVVDH